ncbi:MAG: hypothetical protein J0G37_18000 [Afipia sp.]|nr:hypothetical protein [Afipia sp.]
MRRIHPRSRRTHHGRLVVCIPIDTGGQQPFRHCLHRASGRLDRARQISGVARACFAAGNDPSDDPMSRHAGRLQRRISALDVADIYALDAAGFDRDQHLPGLWAGSRTHDMFQSPRLCHLHRAITRHHAA